MNKLDTKTRAQILAHAGRRHVNAVGHRLTGVSINTVTKLLDDAGRVCHGAPLAHRCRTCTSKRVQCDEIWSFCGAKQKNVADRQGRPRT